LSRLGGRNRGVNRSLKTYRRLLRCGHAGGHGGLDIYGLSQTTQSQRRRGDKNSSDDNQMGKWIMTILIGHAWVSFNRLNVKLLHNIIFWIQNQGEKLFWDVFHFGGLISNQHLFQSSSGLLNTQCF
jgi:hypothetical protein